MMASDSVATISRDVSSRRNSVVEASITCWRKGRKGQVSKEGKTAACRGVWEGNWFVCGEVGDLRACGVLFKCLNLSCCVFYLACYVPVVCARRRACAARG